MAPFLMRVQVGPPAFDLQSNPRPERWQATYCDRATVEKLSFASMPQAAGIAAKIFLSTGTLGLEVIQPLGKRVTMNAEI
jgi:hypothetical protein